MNNIVKNGTHMDIFMTFTLKWWQTGLFIKWGMLALGIAIGTYWLDFDSKVKIVVALLLINSANGTFVI